MPTRRRATVAEQFLRSRPRPGDILLFRHPERFRSTLISWFTNSPYYHVGIYAGGGDVIEARLPQVVRRNLYSQKDGYRFVVIHAPTVGVGAAALAWAEARVGASYDLNNLILWVLGRLFHIPWLCQRSSLDRYICGNFVVRAFAAAGVDLFPGRLPAEICPADFAVYRDNPFPEVLPTTALRGKRRRLLRRGIASVLRADFVTGPITDCIRAEVPKMPESLPASPLNAAA